MADGYARASGRVAACFVITGPGLTNIATAMCQAWSDSVPMLVISSVNRRDELALGEGRLHELPDQAGLARGIAAQSHHITSPADLAPALDQAMQLFHTKRPGPCHIQIPLDLLTQPLPHGWQPPAPSVPGQPKIPDPAVLDAAAASLQQAAEPVLILGGGARAAGDAVLALLRKKPMPVILTIAAKGLIPPDHPCLIGSHLPLACVQQQVQEADLLLAAGTELGETDSLLFGDVLRPGGDLIRIDLDPLQFCRRPGATLGIEAAAAPVLAGIAGRLSRPERGFRQKQQEVCRRLRQAAGREVQDSWRLHGKLLDCIQELLPEAIFVGDSTQPVYGANISFNASQPHRYFNSTTGYGTLGYALPAAVGAALARPEARPVCITGDGGLQFSLPELMVAKELAVPLIVIIWNNGGYEEIRRSMREAGVSPVGVDPSAPDFCLIAAAFGCSYKEIRTRADLTAELREAGRRNAPSLLEMHEAVTLDWLAAAFD